jgi:hypothetical protein
MVIASTRRKILCRIKKYLEEQEGGYGSYSKILNCIVNENRMISEKLFKVYLRQLRENGKLVWKDREEGERITGKRQPLYCMPDWAEKEEITKADIDELRKDSSEFVREIKTKMDEMSDNDLTVTMYNWYSKLFVLNARLRIRQEFTGDRASPEYDKLVKETVPKMINELFTIFKKFPRKRKNKLVGDLLSLMEDQLEDMEEVEELETFPDGRMLYSFTKVENKLLQNIR